MDLLSHMYHKLFHIVTVQLEATAEEEEEEKKKKGAVVLFVYNFLSKI